MGGGSVSRGGGVGGEILIVFFMIVVCNLVSKFVLFHYFFSLNRKRESGEETRREESVNLYLVPIPFFLHHLFPFVLPQLFPVFSPILISRLSSLPHPLSPYSQLLQCRPLFYVTLRPRASCPVLPLNSLPSLSYPYLSLFPLRTKDSSLTSFSAFTPPQTLPSL